MASAPHPLAAALIQRLQSQPGSRVLEFAAGRGRNTEALRAAGFTVVAIDDVTAGSETPFEGVDGTFAAAISTHGLLHGTVAAVSSRLLGVADRLTAGGLLYATFGSTRDARFGQGERLDDTTFAPIDGDEHGVAHAYFDRGRVAALLKPQFEIESLEEVAVDRVAGGWAHSTRPLRCAVHWFATGQRR